jgi:hypothetical protein
MSTLDDFTEDASQIFVYWLRAIAHVAVPELRVECSAEIAHAVDLLMEGARAIAREEIEAHRENSPHTYPDGSTY